jgi:hypothetical protein
MIIDLLALVGPESLSVGQQLFQTGRDSHLLRPGKFLFILEQLTCQVSHIDVKAPERPVSRFLDFQSIPLRSKTGFRLASRCGCFGGCLVVSGEIIRT